jgi:hypothetical protein
MALVKPEKQAQEEERRHEHEKDQHGFQKLFMVRPQQVATQKRSRGSSAVSHCRG